MKRILIIEDEKALQEVLRDRLEEEGYIVAEALNGVEGWHKLEGQRPDVLILDIILPQKDGFSVLQQMADESSWSTLPVVVLTNLADEPNLERIRTLLGDGAHRRCLVKSDTAMSDILSTIRELEGGKK